MELYYVMSIVDRSRADAMFELCCEEHLPVVLEHLGYGTAPSECLLLYELQETDKAIISTIASAASTKQLMRDAKRKLYMDIPGNGIMMAIPLKSVSGGKALAYITDGQELGGTMPTMKFDYELIVVMFNEGYADIVMDAARSAGATGGTVLHAKSTAKGKAEKFYGVSLAEEKDMLYILALTAKKSAIMQSINRDCGLHTSAGAVSFSLPVSEVAGMRMDLDEEEDAK